MKLYFILLISTFFILVSCMSTTLIVKENTQKEKYSIRKNDLIKIILEANPSTLYEWQIVYYDSSKVKIINESYIAKETKRDMEGSGGNKIYIIKAIDKGTTSIKLDYFRPFEKELPRLKDFSIIVNIK